MVKLERNGLAAAVRWLNGYQIGRPDWLILETTNRCNQKCPICGAGNGTYAMPKGFLPRGWFADLATAAFELRPAAVCLHARGEPLLHPHITELIGALHAKGLQTHMATNGLLLTSDLARGLRNAGLDQLVVSHPGISAENYRACRGADQPPHYETGLMKALQAWEGSGRDVIIRCLTLPAALSDGPQAMSGFLAKWLGHAAVQRVEFTAYQPWPQHVCEDLLPGIHSRPRICDMTFDRLAMLWDGTLTPCSNDIRGELAIGRWPQISLHRAFNCPEVRRVRRAHMHRSTRRNALCRRCLLPRAASPLAFASRRELSGRRDAQLEKWFRHKGRLMWRFFDPR